MAGFTWPLVRLRACAIIDEAQRDETPLPLYFADDADLTGLASALIIDPSMTRKMTACLDRRAGIFRARRNTNIEYNLSIDVKAAQVVFDFDIAIWQMPRNTSGNSS